MSRQLQLVLLAAGISIFFRCSANDANVRVRAQSAVQTVAGFLVETTGSVPSLSTFDGRDLSDVQPISTGFVAIYREGEELIPHSADDRGYFEIRGLSLVGDERILFEGDGYQGVEINLSALTSDQDSDGRVVLLVELLPGECEPQNPE